MKSILTVPLLLIAFFLTACSGGGSGSSSKPVFLTVSNHTPTANQKQVPYDENIVIRFSESINENALVNLDANISELLASKDIVAVNKTSKTNVSSITIDQLKSGNYYLVKASDPDSMIFITGGNWDGSGSAKTLTLVSTSGNIVFSAEELIAAELDKKFQNVVRLTSNGTRVPFSLSVSGNTITLDPVGFFPWSQVYTVSIQSSLVSTSGRTMNAAFSYSFTSESQPEMRILNYSPLGQETNPMDPVRIEMNFEVDESSLVDGTLVVNKVVSEELSIEEQSAKVLKAQKAFKKKSTKQSKKGQETQNVENSEEEVAETLEPVEGVISYEPESKTIVFTPSIDFEYTTRFRVSVNKGTSKISGSVGISNSAELEDEAEFEFVTQAPKVIGTLPEDETTETTFLNSVTSPIEVEFNFRPLQLSLDAVSIEVEDDIAGLLYHQEYKAEGTKVIITPKGDKNRWEYGRVLTVRVTPSVISDIRDSTFLPETYEFKFSTERRKVIAVTPYNGDTNVAEQNLKVQAQFNFDALEDSVNESTLVVYSEGVRLPGSVSYNKETRTATFETVGLYNFNQRFSAEITDGILGEDGIYSIYEGYIWDFEVRNQELKLSLTVPSNGSSYVPVLEEFVITTNYPVKSEQVKTGYGTFTKSVVAQYDGCGSGYISGYTSWDGSNRFEFVPDSVLKSDCRVVVKLDDDLRGERGQEPEDEFTFSFRTDFVDVTNVSYYGGTSSSVWVDSSFDISFTHDLDYVSTSDVKLYKWNCSGAPQSITLSRTGNRLTIYPTFDMDYDEDYCIRIQAGIESTTGEELTIDHTFSFNTESIPLQVVNYGPTGSYVSTDTDFYVTTNFLTSHPAFPSWDGDVDWVSESEYESGYEVSVQPTSYLDYDSSYGIDFTFYVPDGNVYVSWSITTEPDPNPPEELDYAGNSFSSQSVKQDPFLNMIRKYKDACSVEMGCDVQSAVTKVNADASSEPMLRMKRIIPLSYENQDRVDQRNNYMLEKAREVKRLQ